MDVINNHVPYRMLFRDSLSGYTIQAPPIDSIGIVNSETGRGSACIKTCPLHVVKAIRVDQCVLLDNSGMVLRRSNFDQMYHMICGDSLIVYQNIEVPFKVYDFEEIAELLRKGRV